ncbi:cytochrome P450 [Schizophyllum commune]
MQKRQRYLLPPGPSSLPLIGSLLSMPSEQEWKTYAEWGTIYGPISSVSVLGQRIVIVNSLQIAADLLDKRSAIYSDRPTLAFVSDCVGWCRAMVFRRYGPDFRTIRRLVHSVIGTPAAIRKFDRIEEEEVHGFLQRLLAKPADFADHIRHMTGAIILRISHGYRVLPQDDPFNKLAEDAMDKFSKAASPRNFPANVLPFLLKLPEWFPGAGFKRTGRAWRATFDEMAELPFRLVKTQLANGTAEDSFASRMLEEKSYMSSEEEDIIKWAATSLHAGGADTTVASIHALFRFMAMNPDAQAKAQAEIDEVVGTDRLPTIEDRENLPYVNALALEVLRAHAVAPTGVAHRLMKDDVYNGFFIPKGSLIVANLWQMLHEENTYDRPNDFRPERFLAGEGRTPEKDPRTICFGFGRRICPGKTAVQPFLADVSLFLACAAVLSVFNIRKWQENGVEVDPIEGQTSGTVSHPWPFKCIIVPRSGKAAALIQSDIYA